MVLCSQVYILKKNEGGRHTPFVNNYSPQLFTRTASVSTAMMLPDGIQQEMLETDSVIYTSCTVHSVCILVLPSLALYIVLPSLALYIGLYYWSQSVLPSLALCSGVEMVMPGDDTELTLTLKHDIPLETGQRFTLRDGGKTIGHGVVTKILQ